jgi:hypothetical protein
MQPGYKRVIVIWLVSSTGGITVALHLIPQINILLQAYDKFVLWKRSMIVKRFTKNRDLQRISRMDMHKFNY